MELKNLRNTIAFRFIGRYTQTIWEKTYINIGNRGQIGQL